MCDFRTIYFIGTRILCNGNAQRLNASRNTMSIFSTHLYLYQTRIISAEDNATMRHTRIISSRTRESRMAIIISARAWVNQCNNQAGPSFRVNDARDPWFHVYFRSRAPDRGICLLPESALYVLRPRSPRARVHLLACVHKETYALTIMPAATWQGLQGAGTCVYVGVACVCVRLCTRSGPQWGISPCNIEWI